MACEKCEWKGFIIEEFLIGNKNGEPEKEIKPCRWCNDVKLYSAKIREMYGTKPINAVLKAKKALEENNIIPLNEKIDG